MLESGQEHKKHYLFSAKKGQPKTIKTAKKKPQIGRDALVVVICVLIVLSSYLVIRPYINWFVGEDETSGLRRDLHEKSRNMISLKVSREAKTRYYNIQFVGYGLGSNIEYNADSIYAEINDFMKKKFGISSRRKPSVIIFESEADYALYLESLGKKQTGGGSYDPRFQEISICKCGWDDYWLHQALAHETTHHILHQHIPNPPAWINEGLAEYIEESLREDYTFEYGRVNRRKIELLKTALRPGAYVPFREFDIMGSKDFKRVNSENTFQKDFVYAQAWSMIAMLLHTNKENEKVLRGYVRRLTHRGYRSFEDCIGKKKLDELEFEWVEFIAGL